MTDSSLTGAGASHNRPGMGDDKLKYTRGTLPVAETRWPKARIAPRQVVVARDPRPSVERMLEDCAYTLAAQFAQFRVVAQSECFNVQQASSFNKLVASATALQSLEEKRVTAMRLASYSEAELAKLEPEARKLLEESRASRDQ